MLANAEIKFMGDLGCQKILEARWSDLKFIYLKSSEVTDSGCHYLAKASMPQLDVLELGNLSLMIGNNLI